MFGSVLWVTVVSSVFCADSQHLKVVACALIDEVLHTSQRGGGDPVVVVQWPKRPGSWSSSTDQSARHRAIDSWPRLVCQNKDFKQFKTQVKDVVYGKRRHASEHVHLLRQIVWSLLVRGWRAKLVRGETEHAAPNVFLYVAKHIVSQPAALCCFFEAIQSLAKGNFNAIKDLTVTEAIP